MIINHLAYHHIGSFKQPISGWCFGTFGLFFPSYFSEKMLNHQPDNIHGMFNIDNNGHNIDILRFHPINVI